MVVDNKLCIFTGCFDYLLQETKKKNDDSEFPLATPYNLALGPLLFSAIQTLSLESFTFARSLSCLRRIFPLGFLGTASTNTTPPVRCLCLATFVSTNRHMSFASACSTTGSFERRVAAGTTYARGCSVPSLLDNQTRPFTLILYTVQTPICR